MSATNIRDFSVQVARVFAALYEAHPQTVTIPVSVVLGPAAEGGYKPEELTQAEGTLLWLHRNGFVYGQIQGTGHECALIDAQLPYSGFILMNSINPATQKSFGPQVIAAVNENDVRGIFTLGERIVAKLK